MSYDDYSGEDNGYPPRKKKKWSINKNQKEKVPFYKREIVYDESKLKRYAINKLAKQEWGRKELFTKMSRYQKDPDMINKVLDNLESLGYLSDKRRINSVLSQFSHREDVKKTSQRLSQKGFSKEQIKEVVEERSEFETIDEDLPNQILFRKFSSIRHAIGDYDRDELQKLKAKMTRFMAGRGFGFDVIRSSMKDFFDGIDQELDE